jgi:hypothetical protein
MSESYRPYPPYAGARWCANCRTWWPPGIGPVRCGETASGEAWCEIRCVRCGAELEA